MKWKTYQKNIPHRVKVNIKQEYEILHVQDFKDGKTRGESRLDLKQLVLLKGQTAREEVETLFHELIHIWSDEFGANLTESQVLALEKATPYIIETVNILNGVKKNAKKARK